MVGYRLVTGRDPGTRNGHCGLEVQGRGCWHQIDSLAVFDATPAFMYPLRLSIEAKCYKHKKIGIDVVRNSVGVLKDISENYFTHRPPANGDVIQIQRFNYHSAIFSTSGYTSVAQKYAIAHQIFLIDYNRIHAISPLINSIMVMQINDFDESEIKHPSKIKEYFGGLLGNRAQKDSSHLSESGQTILHKVNNALKQIQGSYFAMLQGRWPLHLLSHIPLPEITFRNTDTVRCRVYGYRSNKWSFSPINYNEGEEGWFRLEFKLPEEICNLVANSWDDPVQVANIKERHFSYMVLSGSIGGIKRIVKLELDRDWIENYKRRMRNRT